MSNRRAQEGADLAAQGLARLQILASRLDRLPNLDTITVSPASQLGQDAQVNDYDPADQQVVFAYAVAKDHLETLYRHLTADGGGLPAFAAFTLVRAAVEAAAQGIWLLSGGTRDKRVFRSLQAIRRSRDDAEPLARSLGLSNTQGYKRMLERLEEIKAKRSALNQRDLGASLHTTAILIEADRHVKTTAGLKGLDVWRAGSGVAHANRSTALMFTELEEVEGMPLRRSSTYRLTSSFYVVSLMVEVALDYLETLHQMYARAAS